MTKTKLHPGSWLLPMAAVVALVGAIPAHAGLVVSVSSVSVMAGTTGASIEINVQNTGPAQNIAGFSLGVLVAGTDITFTGGDQVTFLTYLFNGDSFNVNNGFPFTTVPPPNGPNVQAGDLSDSGVGTTMGITTLGLGRLIFDVSGSAGPGDYSVTIAPDCSSVNYCTSFSDNSANDLPFTTANGAITVVPEPSTFLLGLIAVPAIALRRRRSAVIGG